MGPAEPICAEYLNGIEFQDDVTLYGGAGVCQERQTRD